VLLIKQDVKFSFWQVMTLNRIYFSKNEIKKFFFFSLKVISIARNATESILHLIAKNAGRKFWG
jgi:hypothetical protein